MDAKKLHDEDSVTPRSSSSVQPTSLQNNIPGAKSWPGKQQRSLGASLNNNLNADLKHESTAATNKALSDGGATIKENRHPNNLTAMKQIMRRKQMSAPQGAITLENNISDDDDDNKKNKDDELVATACAAMDDVLNINNDDSILSLSLDKDSTTISSWAMLGNHLNETTMDMEDISSNAIDNDDELMAFMENSDLMITPVALKRRQHAAAMQKSNNANANTAESLSSGGNTGVSGVLSFLGDSPMFDQTTINQEGNDIEEAERNLCSSAEKVKRLEEHLLRSVVGDENISPVQPSLTDENNNNSMKEVGKEKEVTFAIQDGWQTPRGNGSAGDGTSKYRSYPKSPYVNGGSDDGMLMTPTTKKRLGESMEAQANPMNESVIISDDETSGDELGSPSPMKGIGGDHEVARHHGSTYEEDEFDTFESNEGEILGNLVGSSKESGRRNITKTTPTRASLMERNQTLVKEVRFADQTCVELSERKKYYKSQAGQYKENLAVANTENSLLRTNHEASLQENTKLQVLVESLQAQKNQADLQVEAYRSHVTDAEKTHRSSLKKMEKTYQSHLKNSEEQVNSLNAANASLQSKLDNVHNEWETKLHQNNDTTSKDELIASLKGRIAAGDTKAQNTDTSMQAMKVRLNDLQKLCDQHKNEVQRERNEREIVEHDREELQMQCNDLHRQLTEWAQTSDTLGDVFFNEDGSMNMDFVEELKEYTPVKKLNLDRSTDSANNPPPHTPTSNLLARTLQSELKRRETISDKLDHAEQKITSLKDQMSEMKLDHEEVKADNALLVEDIEERDAHIVELQVEIAEKDARLNAEIEEAGDMPSTNEEDVASSQEESQNSNNRETVSMLEERLDAVEETLEFTDDELTETKARLADTQELLDYTAIKLEQSEEELVRVRDEVSHYEAQVDILFKDVTEKEIEHANLLKFSDFQASTLEAMKEKNSQSDKLNIELRVQLKSCFQSLVALEKILKVYEGLEGVAGKTMAEQGRKVARLLETLQQFAEDHDVSMDAGDVEEASTDLHVALQAASVCNKCAFNQHQLDHLRERVGTLKMERDTANDQLRTAHQEFRDELSKQDEDMEFLRVHCNELGTDLKICQTENKSLAKASADKEHEMSQQLSTVRSKNADTMTQNETLRISLRNFEIQLDNEKSLLRASREDADSYRQDVANAKSAFECLTTESAMTKDTLANVEKEAHDLRKEVNQKEKKLKDCQEKFSQVNEQHETLKARCADLETKLFATDNDRLRAEASLDDASNHIAMLEDALKAKEDESEELIVHVKQVRNALTEVEGDMAGAGDTIEMLEKEIQEKKSVLFEAEESIILYKDEILRLRNDLTTTISEKDSRIQMLEHSLSSRQTLFSQQLDNVKTEREATTNDLTGMIDRLKEELLNGNQSKHESEDRAKVAIRELEEELMMQNESLQAQEEEIIRCRVRLDEETTKYESLGENAQNEISVLMMDIERLRSKTEDDKEELLDEKSQCEKKMHSMQIKVEEADERREQLLAEYLSLEKKSNILKDKVKSLNDKNKQWEESYGVQRGEVNRLANQLTDLKKLLCLDSGELSPQANMGKTPYNTPKF